MTQGKRKDYPQETQDKEFGLIVQHALASAIRLELFPKSTIDLHIQVLECDGTLAALAGAITCASVAVVDAGIDMLDTVVAASAGLFGTAGDYSKSAGYVALDCNAEEEKLQTGSVLISFMPSLNMVTHFIQSGESSVNTACKTMDLCLDACSQIHGIVYQSLVNSAFEAEK
jgi:exosome complex component MTR3